MLPPCSIYWFRQDLRLTDNPALLAASKQNNLIIVYILDDENSSSNQIGAASRIWLHHSLKELNQKLENRLACYSGDPIQIFAALRDKYPITDVYWNRCYEPWQIQRDSRLTDLLQQQGISVHDFNGSLLWEPWEILKKDGTPYKVFTPYYQRGCHTAPPPRIPLQRVKLPKLVGIPNQTVDKLYLLPEKKWARHIADNIKPGELAAQHCLKKFIQERLIHYKAQRDHPAQEHTSTLAPHLHFGELSPHTVWNEISTLRPTPNTEAFLRQLGWREFSYYLLYHFPELPSKNFQPKFDRFTWTNNPNFFQAWKTGTTGYPLVDAGMRELWQTGNMHNRVRMVVASFLIKNLLIDWRKGQAWFWDCLFDADLANNSAGWQWVAGSGADAAPYFRIFNPTTQAKKFDADGIYIRQYVPELQKLPLKYLFSPWEAPEHILQEAGITLGMTYPHPIVDLASSRKKALENYSLIR